MTPAPERPEPSRGTICVCGSAKAYHRPQDKQDHEYEPRYPAPAPERPTSRSVQRRVNVMQGRPMNDGITPAPERPDLRSALIDWLETTNILNPAKLDNADVAIAEHVGLALAAAPVTDAGLDVERLAHALHNITGWRWPTETWTTVAAEYAALSRQAEKETA